MPTSSANRSLNSNDGWPDHFNNVTRGSIDLHPSCPSLDAISDIDEYIDISFPAFFL